jgi:hypothetical protein
VTEDEPVSAETGSLTYAESKKSGTLAAAKENADRQNPATTPVRQDAVYERSPKL